MDNVLYTAEALSTGGGRDGRVRTADGTLDLVLAAPPALGGSGEGANPEQLFAAGYAACFHSALLAVARSQKVRLADSAVGSRVHIGPNGSGGFQLSVELEVTVPGVPLAQTRELADEAHLMCPYSNATRGNIEVTITISDA